MLPLLESHSLPFQLHTTSSPKDAANIGHSISITPPPHKVIIAGGDGTAHEMMEGVDSGRWELVILPLGTANALYYSFFPDDDTKLASLHLALRGSPPRRLPVTYADLGDTVIPSTIVTSTALHAAILNDSERLRPDHGIERFAMAAMENISVFFDAEVELVNATQWNHTTRAFEQCEQSLAGPFAYFTSCTTVDRLEPKFVIAPTRRIEPGLEGTMDIVVLRPLRDPDVRGAEDRGAVWAKRAQQVLGAAYQDGAHVNLEYPGGEPVVEVFRCTGFVWTPRDEKSRTLCADGSIYQIPQGGSARVEVRSSGEDGFWAWV